MHATRNWIILVLALCLLMGAVAIEHADAPVAEHTAPVASLVFSLSSVIDLMRESAFALFIALVISVGIEAESRRSDERKADDLRKRIAQDVFKGVFSRSMPPEYVEAVISTTVNPPLLRERLNISYSLDPAADAIPARLEETGAVLLTRNVTYRLRNVSGEPVTEKLRIFLPSPVPGLRPSSVREFRCGPSTGQLVNRLDEMTVEDDGDGRRTYSYDLALAKDECIDVVMTSVTAKELISNEVWSSAHPTLRADVALNVRIPGICFGLVDRTATPADKVYVSEDGSSGRWELNGPMLPNDSLTLWWRPDWGGRSSPVVCEG